MPRTLIRLYLEAVIRRVPIRALYASGGLERVFFLLLGFRPAYRNAELAAEKTDDSRQFGIPRVTVPLVHYSRVFPTTVLIDRSGMPRQSVIGELDWMDAVAKQLVEPLLALPKSA